MSEPAFSDITCRRQDGVLVIALNAEEIQGDEAAENLRRQFLEAAAHFGATKIVLDFAKVHFLTSTAFRPLISLHRRIQEKKGRLVFCNLRPELAEVFIVTRLVSPTRSVTAPFEMAKDVPEALSRLRVHTSRTERGVLILTLTERHLAGESLADELTAELSATVADANATQVVLDFERVETLTTPSMRPLITLVHQLRAKGGRLLLCNLRPLVAEVLTVTRLISPGGGQAPLETVPNVAAALAVMNA
jgi:anti-anti-sigma factor